MRITTRISLVAAVGLALGSCGGMQSQQRGMSFFVTSAGSGKGADLGGLDGADRHCQSLAKATGSRDRNWRAYLSTSASGGGISLTAARNLPGQVDRNQVAGFRASVFDWNKLSLTLAQMFDRFVDIFVANRVNLLRQRKLLVV